MGQIGFCQSQPQISAKAGAAASQLAAAVAKVPQGSQQRAALDCRAHVRSVSSRLPADAARASPAQQERDALSQQLRTVQTYEAWQDVARRLEECERREKLLVATTSVLPWRRRRARLLLANPLQANTDEGLAENTVQYDRRASRGSTAAASLDTSPCGGLCCRPARQLTAVTCLSVKSCVRPQLALAAAAVPSPPLSQGTRGGEAPPPRPVAAVWRRRALQPRLHSPLDVVLPSLAA